MDPKMPASILKQLQSQNRRIEVGLDVGSLYFILLLSSWPNDVKLVFAALWMRSFLLGDLSAIPTKLTASQQILVLRPFGVNSAMIDMSKKLLLSLEEVALQLKTITREVYLRCCRMAA